MFTQNIIILIKMGGDGGVIANQRRFVRGCEKGSL
jgi:hypothetical protein